jgi:UDP:flavonoid glycosyltransferase YjiC (YdhE family)
MRILFTACPMYGHVNTVLPLALAAQRAGHQVAVATGADFAEHVARRGLEPWPVGPTYAEAGGAPRSPRDFVTAAEKRAIDLVPRAVQWAPELVVHEETELAGLIAARRAGARRAMHGLGLAATGDADPFAVGGAELGRRWAVPGLDAAYRRSTYISIAPPRLRPTRAAAWNRLLPLRPAVGEPTTGDRLPPAIDALPHERTVHLTLGTVFHDPVVLATALAGLRDMPVNIVATVGPGLDPSGFGPQPSHVLIERYLPHALLLPRCDLVVSQGGAGILLGTLAHGLPQLVLPQGADQFANADAAVRAGTARTLGPADMTTEAITRSATRLLADPTYAAAARAVAAEIAAMPGPTDVLDTLATGQRCELR